MTYWDHLGWRDTFGSEAFTARQRDYEAGLGRDGPFTPQVVVKGVGDTVGNRLDPLRTMIGRTKPPAKVPIDIKSNVIESGAGMAPASGAETRNGTFTCAGCERDLFASDTKFESGTGWPSFRQPVRGGVVTTRDTSFGMVRDAVECSRCGGHLGHVFDDGPKPTGLRYCMNGIAMHFRPAAA